MHTQVHMVTAGSVRLILQIVSVLFSSPQLPVFSALVCREQRAEDTKCVRRVVLGWRVMWKMDQAGSMRRYSIRVYMHAHLPDNGSLATSQFRKPCPERNAPSPMCFSTGSLKG